MMVGENLSFVHWENLLRDRNPVRDAERLADAVLDPASATADECWELIWSKPLFANSWVQNGENAVQRLRPFMKRAWLDWGLDGSAFIISHRRGSNQRDNFEVSGNSASDIDELGIARHRLLAIQGGANLLRTLVKEAPDYPLKPLLNLNRGEMVGRILTLAGRGWGHITALHLMTDFGLAVKPDLHLVRTVKAIGLLPDLHERNVPRLNEALRINDAVDELGRQIFGQSFGPGNRRYLDKILMELSRQGLLDTINHKETA